MPFSIPTTFSYPWAEVLNRHMAQLMNPSTGGINVWDIRPTIGVNGQSLGPDHVGFTGYNSTSRAFERWNGSNWDILTSSGASSMVMPTWNTSSRPSSPSAGDFGYNTSTKQIERWSGSNWQPVASNDLDIWNSSTRPILSAEQMGKMGYNTTTRQLERWNGNAWENITSPVVPPLAIWSSVTRPALQAQDAGQFGYNTTTKQIERWNGSTWDNVTPPLDSSSMTSMMPSWSSRPTVTSADAGRFGYNTSTKKIERWDGTNWIDVSPRSDTPFGMGAWNTSSRPLLTGADAGVFGYNTETLRVERWNGSTWVPVTGLSSGSPLIPFWTTSSRPNLTSADAGHTGFNTTTNQLETWNGSTWVPIAPNAALSSTGSQASSIPTWTTGTRPSSPAPGTIGYNSTLPGLEVWNGSNWVPANQSNPSVGATAPIGPTTGQLWYDLGSGQLNVWNGSAWVPANTSTGGGAATLPQWTTGTRPSNPSLGTMGYNTQTGSPEMWNGSGWVPLNTPPSDYRPTYQTWTDGTRPTNVPVGTVGYNSTSNQLEMWNGSSWQPISGGIPRLASRPFNPTEGYIYYNTASDVVEYYTGTEWITLSRSGVTSGGAGSSWENPLQVNSNTTGQAGKYYLLDPANGPFEFMLPSNPAVGTEVCIRGLTSALTNSVYINPNGKKFLGSTSRRVYSGTTPICITYIDETTGWSPSAAIPIEVVTSPPPADIGLYCWLRSDLGVFKAGSSNFAMMWSGDINSNPYQLEWNAAPQSGWTTEQWAQRYSPNVEANVINGKPAIVSKTDSSAPSVLVDKSVPMVPSKSTIFIVASTDNNASSRPGVLLLAGSQDVAQTENSHKGFIFSTWGIHQTPIIPNGTATGFHLLFPSAKRAPNNSFTVHVYQIDYDISMWALLNSNGEYLGLGNFVSCDRGGNRMLAIAKYFQFPFVWTLADPFYNYHNVNTAGEIHYPNTKITEIKWYNNLLSSDQVKAVCDSLRTTYNLQYMM
jgi:hypothetical protein